MLLAVDIGNTNIVVALFDGDEIIQEWRLHSDPNRTADDVKPSERPQVRTKQECSCDRRFGFR